MPRTTNDSALALKSSASDPISARIPFFYGWVMLPIAVIGLINQPRANLQHFGIQRFFSPRLGT